MQTDNSQNPTSPAKPISRKLLKKRQRSLEEAERQMWQELRDGHLEALRFEFAMNPTVGAEVTEFCDQMFKQWTTEKRRMTFLTVALIEGTSHLIRYAKSEREKFLKRQKEEKEAAAKLAKETPASDEPPVQTLPPAS